jgi:uncharacterized protein YjbJ (UPF0337 family)
MGDENRIAGKVKELGGRVTGDKKLESEGKVQNAKGKVENAVDDVKDTARGAVEGITGRGSKD